MRLRLKDLPKIAKEQVDVPGVVSEVVGYRKKRFFNDFFFGIALRKAMTLIHNGRQLDLEILSLSEDCKIKVPSHVDNITFRAMVELQSICGNASKDSDVVEVMSSVIAVACYSENVDEKDYDSECESFKKFKERILNEPLEHMVGLYNFITESVGNSQKEWQKRFLSVEITSEEMRKAGVDALQQFSIINTIKTMCADFNCNYNEAWQMSYAVSQTNSYAKATTDHVHENLRILKEHKMKAQSKAKRHS